MDVPADRSRSTSALPVDSSLGAAVRSPRQRRPTGAPPPLPYRLQTSGVGWLVAAVVLVGLALAVFARGLRGPAIAATVIDDTVVRWLAGLQAPGLEALLRGLMGIGSWWVLYTASYGLALALLVLRRWRHLLVWFLAVQLGSNLTLGLAMIFRRQRPFGVDLKASWGGWALPSVQVTFLTAILMGVLYTLVPEGRWRNTGKWVAAAIVALVGLARVALGVDAPTDVLLGLGIGVTIPLLAFRRFTPSEVFPITYRRGRAAHLDVGGARGAAIRRGLEDQLGLVVEEVKPFGLAGSAGSTPLRITVKGDPPRQLFGKLYAQSHLRADRWYKLRPRAAVRAAGGREAVQHRAAAGAAGGLRPGADAARRPAEPDPVRVCRAHPRTGVPAGHRVLRRRHRARRGRGHRRRDRRRPVDHPPAVGRRPCPPRHQARQPAGPRRAAAADRRGLRGGPPLALAAGGGPGQHDAVSGPARQSRAGLPAGAAVLHRGGDHRGVRAAHPAWCRPHPPGRPWAGPALPAARAAPGSGA